MEALQTLVRAVITISLVALVFSVGMDATPKEVASLVRQPRRLLAALVAVNLVTPVAGAVLIAVFPLSAPAKAALMLMAVSPVPPFVPAKVMRGGARRDYAYGLYATLAVLAVIIVPAMVAVLSRIYGVRIAISPVEVAREVVSIVLLPMSAGLLTRWRFPRFAERAAPQLAKAATAFVVVAAVLIVGSLWRSLWGMVGHGLVAAAVLMTVVAVSAGHLLGGPEPNDRTCLAVTAATRHPGLALMIARVNDLDRRTSFAILLLLLVSFVAVAPYYAWRKRRSRQAACSGSPADGGGRP